jgi:hypothetical protein
VTNPDIHISYRETRDGRVWFFDSTDVKDLLGDYALLGKVKELLYNSYKEFTGGELL